MLSENEICYKKEVLSREKYRQRLILDKHGKRNGDDRAGNEQEIQSP